MQPLALITRAPGLPEFTEHLNIAYRTVTYERENIKRKGEPVTLRLKAPEGTLHPFKAEERLSSWTGQNFKLSRVVVRLGKLFNPSDFSFLLFKLEEHSFLAGLLSNAGTIIMEVSGTTISQGQ